MELTFEHIEDIMIATKHLISCIQPLPRLYYGVKYDQAIIMEYLYEGITNALPYRPHFKCGLDVYWSNDTFLSIQDQRTLGVFVTF